MPIVEKEINRIAAKYESPFYSHVNKGQLFTAAEMSKGKAI